jgi:hemolysin III
MPEHSVSERLVDGCIHALGVAASVAAAVALIIAAIRTLSVSAIAPLAIYSAGLVAMFAFSAAYHLAASPRPKARLRRFDHAAIFVMIAGTYTPLTLLKMGGIWGVGLCAAVWTIALCGAGAKLLLAQAFDRISMALYLVQGWLALIAIEPLAAAVSRQSLLLICLGGILYTAGVVFHVWEKLRYHNAIWHGFVLAAASVHYAAILDAMNLF